FEDFFYLGTQIGLVISLDALGQLAHYRQPHRNVEPVKKMLGLWVQIHLENADRVAAVRQERDRLVHLHSLGFEHLEQTAFGLVVVAAILLPTITSNHPSVRDCWSFAWT